MQNPSRSLIYPLKQLISLNDLDFAAFEPYPMLAMLTMKLAPLQSSTSKRGRDTKKDKAEMVRISETPLKFLVILIKIPIQQFILRFLDWQHLYVFKIMAGIVQAHVWAFHGTEGPRITALILATHGQWKRSVYSLDTSLSILDPHFIAEFIAILRLPFNQIRWNIQTYKWANQQMQYCGRWDKISS